MCTECVPFSSAAMLLAGRRRTGSRMGPISRENRGAPFERSLTPLHAPSPAATGSKGLTCDLLRPLDFHRKSVEFKNMKTEYYRCPTPNCAGLVENIRPGLGRTLFAAALLPVAGLAAPGIANTGKTVFGRCNTCHNEFGKESMQILYSSKQEVALSNAQRRQMKR